MSKVKTIPIFDDFLSLLYPELCQACGNSLFKNEYLICLPCFYKLPKTKFNLEKNNPLEKIFWGRIPVQKASAFLYFSRGSRVQNLMHQFKYRSKKEIGFFLGELFAKDLKKEKWLEGIDIIVPIPLHYKKQKIRGYNQSEEFGKGLTQNSGIALATDVIKRTISSETQTKKSRYHRWENVREIFEVIQSEKIKNKHILIIDDVITTGSTIEACARQLLKIEGVKISIASLAFAG